MYKLCKINTNIFIKGEMYSLSTQKYIFKQITCFRKNYDEIVLLTHFPDIYTL